MMYALGVLNLNEYFVQNVNDHEFVDMIDDVNFYQDEGTELIYKKDETIIKNSLYSTYYFDEEAKRDEKIKELKSKNQKVFSTVSSYAQRNEPSHEV